MTKLLNWQKTAFSKKTDSEKLKTAISAYKKNPATIIIYPQIVDYAWGGKKFIPDLLGIKNPKNEPQAELWIGAHPKFPARVKIDDSTINLNELIDECPKIILGEKVSKKFNNKLPYLMKILVAGDTLSIQAHPNKKQAEAGFKRENKLGIGLEAYNRNYRDRNHKPELALALTPFWVMKGFRPAKEIIKFFQELDIASFRKDLLAFEKSGNIKKFYQSIMSSQKIASQITSFVTKKIRQNTNKSIAELWVLRMNEQYKNDLGILAPYFLNLFCLKTGEALFLQARELHCYLGKLNLQQKKDNAIIEVMANSDNVLRGGLTPKYVDVAELIKTLNFSPSKIKMLKPKKKTELEKIYQLPIPEFETSEINISADKKYLGSKKHSADIYLVYQGEIEITDSNSNKLKAKKGQTFLAPAISGKYVVRALDKKAILYKTSVPL